MKKERIIPTIGIALALIPFFASADTGATTTATSTEAQVFTSCSQAAIEVRDNSIGTARTTYNTAMAAALSARKQAEIDAVAITNDATKRAAILTAVNQYKQAVTTAQDTLTNARKEAWNTFETDTNKCRNASKEMRKSATLKDDADTDAAALSEDTKPATQSLGETILRTIKNFLGLGGGDN